MGDGKTPIPDPGAPEDHSAADFSTIGPPDGANIWLPVSPAAEAPFAEGPQSVIGRFRLLEKIGEGGFGAVFVAEQKHPIKRRVALKIIKLGMDTKEVIARFEAERQALAMMDHPNIAKVYDAGATDTGRPYFVMELVRGIPITEYCDQNNLPPVQRLKLFIAICHAIQHAHQKGIIHRDIKPSNILVTLHDGVPVPKVIDFGIAKATQGELTDKTVYTQFQQFVGTPAYMSPEQAEMSGLDIDTRSDIYSLGVLLYELLTGTTPFDAKELANVGMDEMRRKIRETDPARPSNRLRTMPGDTSTTTAKRRGMEARQLISLLRGDLDWIVMKCLEKDRTRRYETANGLAVDIHRHLNNEPISARPPNPAYRFRKLVRRNRLTFVAAAAVIMALVFGIAASSWQAIRATQAQNQAMTARRWAEMSEQKAVSAQANEAKLREQAEAQAFAARQRAYSSEMNLAEEALTRHNLGRAVDLLTRQRPLGNQKDLRGWEWRYLWGQTRSDALFTLCQEPSEVYSVSVSPDGQLLAIGQTRSGGVDLWDLRNRRHRTRLAANEGLACVAFSPTQPLLAFTSADAAARRYTLHLWNSSTEQMIAEFSLDYVCAGLAFASDGRTLVTCTRGGYFTIWRVADGAKLASYPSECHGPLSRRCFAATSDLRLAACGESDGALRVVDLHSGKELWTKLTAKSAATAAAFSPDGKVLASAAGYSAGYSAADIRLWDVATGKEIKPPLHGNGSWVISLRFTPDGKTLISAGGDQTIRVWDVASGKCLDELRGHRQEVWDLALMPDNHTIVSGAKDGTVCFWDISQRHQHQERIIVPAENMFDWNFTPDGRSIMTLDRQGQVSLWSGQGFAQRTTLLQTANVSSAPLSYSCFSRDGGFLAIARADGKIEVWNTLQRTLVRQFATGFEKPALQYLFSDGRKLILFSRMDHQIREWDVSSGSEIQSWSGPAVVEVATASPDEKYCVAVGFGFDSVVRNLVDQSQTSVNLDAPETDVAVFSPNGKYLAIASAMGFARVWESSNWKAVATIGNFLNGVHSVGFSPDGRRLAISSHDAEAVRLCDTDSWQDVLTLDGGPGFIDAVVFSPDGNSLVWQGEDGLEIWRAPSWDEISAAEAKQK